MFEIDQAHGLKYMCDRFDRYSWKFLYEKRNDIRDTLKNLFDIDNFIKKLRKENPEVLHKLHLRDPKHADHFLEGACRLVTKMVELMKHEERDIAVLEHVFRKHQSRQIASEKKAILDEEAPEEKYARKLESWARYMDTVLADVHMETGNQLLKKMRKSVRRLIKDMQWFESSVQKEIEIVRKAREAEQLEDLLRSYRHSEA